jgi:hypothetical protein
MCRPTTILAGMFALIAFSDQWSVAEHGGPLRRRIRLAPLIKLAVGVAPFVLLTGLLNQLRFNSPFESGYTYSEQFHQLSLLAQWPYGIADVRYMPLHVKAVFEQMPNIGPNPPFIWPSWWGMAMWATTPPILYAYFVHLQRFRVVAIAGAAALATACGFMLLRAAEQGLGHPGWGDDISSTGIQLWPFWLLLGGALVAAVVARDRLVIAAWAAILAIGFLDWTFAATGWAQFGYRYGLDFMPFLFLLIVLAVTRQGQVRWHHALLIGLAVLVNLWGVLWIFQFTSVPPHGLFGWTWVSY